MPVNNYLWLVLGLLGLCACGTPELPPSELVAWVQDAEHGLKKTRSIPPLQLTALYKPLSYIIAQEQRTDDIATEHYQAREAELSGLQYYTLQVAIEGGGDQDVTNYGLADATAQQERLAYLSFGMQRDIHLVQGGDTLPCRLFHFERSYDLAPHRTFVLAFELPAGSPADQERTLVVELAPFNTGPVKFQYSSATLSHIPNLKL